MANTDIRQVFITTVYPGYGKLVASSLEECFVLFEEVIVEKAVEERISAGRRHSEHVEEGESYHEALCMKCLLSCKVLTGCLTCGVKQVHQLGEDAKHTERQPTVEQNKFEKPIYLQFFCT